MMKQKFKPETNCVKIMLNTIDNVKDFVSRTNRYDNMDIYIEQGRYVIDAKSILGIFSLDLTKEMKLYMENCSNPECDIFISDILRYVV